MSDRTQTGCLGMLLQMMGLSPKAQKNQFPYRTRDDFLSAAELSFYHVLASCVREASVVCPKVRLADIFFVPQLRDNYAAQNRIGQKHVDFLVCSIRDLKPVFGVELDDQSHLADKQRKRDAFVEQTFEAAGLPLLRIKASDTYSIEDVKARVAAILAPASTATSVTEESIVPSELTEMICPKCEIPMIRRTAFKGVNQGKDFYGCKNYPRCKETLPIKA